MWPTKTKKVDGSNGRRTGELKTTVLRELPTPGLETRWRHFLSRSSLASHYLAPEYFLDPRVQGRLPFAILAESDGEIVGCLTGWHDGDVTTSGLATHPQLLVCDGPAAEQVEVALALALRKEAGKSRYVVLHGWGGKSHLASSGFWVRWCHSTCVLSLAPGEEALFKGLSSSRRRAIRKSRRQRVEVRQASPEDVPAFYRLLEATHERLGIMPPLPIESLLKPTTNRKLFVAHHQNRCIAGTIVRLHPGGLAEYSDNASLPEFWSLRPNDQLLWEGMLWARSVGCKAFNFAGDNRFKRGFGGEVYPIYRASIDRTFLKRKHNLERLRRIASEVYAAVRARRRR